GNFNGFVRSVILRISEARDLGDWDRFAFYDRTKILIAAPPDVVHVNEKHLREYYVPNLCGVVLTTNHKTDCIYLPAKERRDLVAWSDSPKTVSRRDIGASTTHGTTAAAMKPSPHICRASICPSSMRKLHHRRHKHSGK